MTSDAEEMNQTLAPIENGTSVASENEGEKKLSKNQLKKLRKKKRKEQKKNEAEEVADRNDAASDAGADASDSGVEIEYVPEEIEFNPMFFHIFEKFRTGDLRKTDEILSSDVENEEDRWKRLVERKKPVELDLKDEKEATKDGDKMSKRQLKKITRMSAADLKSRVSHPELVEMHDVTAKDPITLLELKSTRNTVPVPRHWCFKRKYLQGKRGFEKPPFKLPEFIRRTGIMEMRESVLEKDDAKSLKTKMREKMRPKMGKIDIDYQKLHDAFFKWQSKPIMTIHGDLYFEGKEFDTVLKDKRPGELSNELRIALGMPTGPNAQKVPPPWLISMQRYGPPPSYPNQKIPGLNAPLPEGCKFGYEPGQWGQTPVDAAGNPLYGDVFGVYATRETVHIEEPVDTGLWGEMEEELDMDEEDDEEEEEKDEDQEEEEEANGPNSDAAPRGPGEADTSLLDAGLTTPGGFSSVPVGLETPNGIELRKRKIEASMEMRDNPALFTVLQEKRPGEKLTSALMASTHVYDVAGPSSKKRRDAPGESIDIALDPSDLELDPSEMSSRLLEKADRKDLAKDHAESKSEDRSKAKTSNQDEKKKKKYKEFKF